MMHKTVSMSEVVQTASVVSHPVRFRILKRLLQGPCIVNELVEVLGIDQTQASKHLAVLRRAGLVSCESQGRCRLYSLRRAREVASLIETLYSLTESNVQPRGDQTSA